MRVAALIGAAVVSVAALLLVLALTETRHMLGSKQFGIPWVSRTGHVYFALPWMILIYFEIFSIPFGYAIGDRVERTVDFIFGSARAACEYGAGWLLGMGDAAEKGTAGANKQIFFAYVGALACATLVLEVVRRARRNRKQNWTEF